MALYRVVVLAPAYEGWKDIRDERERDAVEDALAKLHDHPDEPDPYPAKERKDGWEMHVGRWKVTYEIRRIELAVFVHTIKESPSWKFDYRY
jgi:mRNA-degrading endonuclease RelE of RelBE toxin-antitoxin system